MQNPTPENQRMVRVQLFAAARETTGSEFVHLSINQQTTMHDLLKTLHATHPELRKISGRWAVNEEFVDNGRYVRAEDEIAFIPPVSGG